MSLSLRLSNALSLRSGGGGGAPVPADPLAILLEDGTNLLAEDGSILDTES